MPSGFSTPRLLGAALIILAAGAVGLPRLRARHADAPTLTAAPAAPAAVPDTTPAAAGDPREKRSRRRFPTSPWLTSNGKPTKLASFGGRPLMVNFWATWCAPCRREIPLLNKIRMERKPQNAEIVGIAVDFKEDVAQVPAKNATSVPAADRRGGRFGRRRGFRHGHGLPVFSVFVDSQNRILTIKIGELHEDEANFAFDRLQDIDNGVLTREAAQAAVADAFREMAAERAEAKPTSTAHGA